MGYTTHYSIAYTFSDGLRLVDPDTGEPEVDGRVVGLFQKLPDSRLAQFAEESAVRGNIRDPRIRDAPMTNYDRLAIGFASDPELKVGRGDLDKALTAAIMDRFVLAHRA